MDGTTILIIIAAIVIIGGLVVFLRSRSSDGSGAATGGYAPPLSGRGAPPPPPEESPKRSGRGLFDDNEQAAPPQAAPSTGAHRPVSPPQAPAGAPAASAPPPPPQMQPPQPQPAPSTGAHRPVPPPAPDVRGGAKEENNSSTRPVPIVPAPAAPAPVPMAPPPEPEPAAPAADVPPDSFGAGESLSGSAPTAIPTDDVRFTVYYPREASVDNWYTLLTYAHIEAALAKVQADAQRFKAEMGESQRQAQSSDTAKLARGTEITIMPQMDGVMFNPERISFKWVEDLHRAEFRLKANKDLAGLAGNGSVLIFVGPLIVGTVKFGMLFDEAQAPTIKEPMSQASTAKLYKQDQIFASYSHKDTPVVIACRDAYRALGYDVLIDIDDLRSGEKWNQALMDMIDRADIFQLFWSERSSQSPYCKQEWEHALEKSKDKGEGYIRPVYWEKPLVPPPPELGDLHFAYVPLTKPDQP